MKNLNSSNFYGLANLTALDLSSNQIITIAANSFNGLNRLLTL